jgi:hypothetical protein
MISFMILGGAADDGLDATEPPEPTIVLESIGPVLLPVPGRASSGQRESRPSRGEIWGRSRVRGWSRREAVPRLRRGCDDEAEPAAADIPVVDPDARSSRPRFSAQTQTVPFCAA